MSRRDPEEARSTREEGPSTGGEPQTFGRCTECETVYLVQLTDDGGARPIGTDGSCACGNDEFVSGS